MTKNRLPLVTPLCLAAAPLKRESLTAGSLCVMRHTALFSSGPIEAYGTDRAAIEAASHRSV